MARVRQIGEWRLGRPLGRGGMGVVYLAESVRTGERAAVKKFLIREAAEGAAGRFEAEAKVLAKLKHANIVGLSEVISTAEGEYLVLELIAGESLRDRLRRGRLPAGEALAIMRGLLQALDYAHRRSVVHLDVKPENVLLASSGEVKVTDFGIARLVRGRAAAGLSTTQGTPQYMSPEQAKGELVDARSDLYSAGVVCYELFAGRPPFPADPSGDGASNAMAVAARHVQAEPEPPSAHHPDLDPELEQVILTSLAKLPADRPQSAAEFLGRLEPIAARLLGGAWTGATESGRHGGNEGSRRGPKRGWIARLLGSGAPRPGG